MNPSAVRSLVTTELRLHRRHGMLAATASMTAVWLVVVLALDSAWRAETVHWVLFFELAVLGFFFVPALAVIERANGVTAALRLTRLAPSTALAVRVAALTATAFVAAAVVLPVSGLGWPPDVLIAVALMSSLVSLLAVVMIGRATTLTAYISRVPAVAVPCYCPRCSTAPAFGNIPCSSGSTSPRSRRAVPLRPRACGRSPPTPIGHGPRCDHWHEPTGARSLATASCCCCWSGCRSSRWLCAGSQPAGWSGWSLATASTSPPIFR